MQQVSMPNNCINKTAYKSWELEAYVDGEDLPHVATHLASCAACTDCERTIGKNLLHLPGQRFKRT